ncbi:MAG: EMC3/TMCO1 family protein [archaeon]
MSFGLINPAMDIALIAIMITLISIVLQKKLMPRERQKQLQQEMKEKQARMKELMKQTDEKSKNELNEVQQEMMQATSKMMSESMKYMVVSLAIFGSIFFLVVRQYQGATFPVGSFTIPVINWTFAPYLVWYILIALVTSLALNGGMKLMEKIRKK